jgi:hypothetical protein
MRRINCYFTRSLVQGRICFATKKKPMSRRRRRRH